MRTFYERHPRHPLRLINWVDDRLNPIVVKELRQAVQARVVVGVLFLLLVTLLITLAVNLIEATGPGRGFNDAAGAELFLVFQSILLATCMFFVPAYVGVRLAAERQGVASDLLYVTTIRPASVVWGKLLAGMVVTALVFSACAPFMVITYLLRGIDLPTILFVLGVDALIVLATTQVAIFVGTLPIGWPVKLLLGMILIGVAGSAYAGVTGAVWGWISFGVGSAMADSDFWVGVAVFVGCWLAGVVTVFLLSVAIVAPPTSNRALPLRVYLTLVWTGTFGLFLWLAQWNGDTELLVVWMAFTLGALVLAVIVSAGERDTVGPRLRRSIPRNRLLRVPAFLFYSGITGGLLWCAILIALTFVAVGVGAEALRQWSPGARGPWGSPFDTFPDFLLSRTISVMCWVFGYVLLSVWLCRRAMKLANGGATGVIALILMCLCSVLPMILAFALNPDRWENDLLVWMTLNPLGPLMVEPSDWETAYGQVVWPLSIGFAVVMLAVNLPWFWRRVRDFHPPRPEGGDAPVSVNPAVRVG